MEEPTTKINYEKDTLCTADIFEEKDCKHFKPYESFVCRYPNICKFQGVRTVCNWVKE
jgi:hypothetical protein